MPEAPSTICVAFDQSLAIKFTRSVKWHVTRRMRMVESMMKLKLSAPSRFCKDYNHIWKLEPQQLLKYPIIVSRIQRSDKKAGCCKLGVCIIGIAILVIITGTAAVMIYYRKVLVELYRALLVMDGFHEEEQDQ